MSKRRSRGGKSPNIPQETLERARRQAAGEDVDSEAKARETSEKDTAAENKSASTRAERRAAEGTTIRRSRTTASTGQVSLSARRKRSNEELTSEEIEERLANPTKIVEEEELHEQYAYVLLDLRNMGILAAILFIVLIGLATVFI